MDAGFGAAIPGFGNFVVSADESLAFLVCVVELSWVWVLDLGDVMVWGNCDALEAMGIMK